VTRWLRRQADDQVIAATSSSGIRSVFCYCPTPRLVSWSPFTTNPEWLGDHVLPKFDELAGSAPWANGRVTLGFAFDGFRFLPKEILGTLMDKLRENQVQLITYHYSRVADQGLASQTVALHKLGILDERWLVSHGGNPDQADADIYQQLGMHVSSTPSTELQMAMGSPVAAFRDDLGDSMPRCCSLGIDCHSNNSAFIPGEARLGLQSARASRGEVGQCSPSHRTYIKTEFGKQRYIAQNKTPKSTYYTVAEAYNLATIRGARAAKMGDRVGSIAKGKQADLVIFSGTSPGMVAAAQHDPVAAVVLHSNPGDIEYVIIDGVIRKSAGKLINVDVDEKAQMHAGQSEVSWEDIAEQVIERRQVLQNKIEQIDVEAATSELIDQWHIDRSKLVDEL
jgi:cytosine/adenosine deaminase-related metal-dependent hydrolase